jgi:Xaa-Pro aminopeptidase
MFTDRQAEVYTLVLQAQKYIEEQTRPGMYLYNAQIPEKSLHHLAVQFFEYHGCAQYFNHKIGHFLGLDVHDVGDTTEPLQEGDVITIEPGLYLTTEGIGVRIEDDYVVVQDGLVCLSEYIPKSIEEIEDFMNSVEKEAFDNV